MNTSLVNAYCSTKYYKQFDSDELLKQVQNKVDSSISNLGKEMLFVFNKVLTTDPCSYWDVSVYKQTSSLLENLFRNYESILEIDETTFNYYLMGYNSYIQLSEIISDLRNFNIAQEVKIRLYHLPTYTAILESCLSNFIRVIATLTGKGIGKDYTSQHTLGSLVQILNSNGYSEITNNINVNLRNAINHGKIQIKKEMMGDKLCFYYVESNLPKTLEMPVYEFDNIIDKSFDTASGVLLAISKFINEHLSLLTIDMNKREYVQFALFAMKLSLPSLYCHSISDTGNTKQLNIEIEIQNANRAYIGEISILLAILVYEKYSEYEQYMFSFSNPRMVNGWARFKNQEIKDMSTKTKSFDDIMKCVIERQDYIIFDQSQEEIDLNEVKYFCFPNIITDTYKINHIQDASIEDRKRLKAHLYVGAEDDKQKLLTIFSEAIEKLKIVKNPPSPAMYHKNGTMDADSLYINVYRIDTRKSKELYPNNDNFVCMLDYNENGITTLKHGGIFESIWQRLHHETIGNLQIAWREGKFVTRHNAEKIGRNDPCPCGSGNKYKKCCGR